MKLSRRSAPFALLAALVLGAVPAHPQAVDAAKAPCATMLRAAPGENQIVLTWTDSPDAKGDYAVFRSESPLDAESLPSASRLGKIASGAQTYKDAPPDGKAYYYGVFALAGDDSPYAVFLPDQNVTSKGVSIGDAGAAVAAPGVTTAAAASDQGVSAGPPQPFVSGMAARAKGDAILISYKASPKSRLVLYRGVAPITGAADLLDATLVAAFTDKDGSFADFPVPGVDYYYALLGEEDLKAGKISIAAGVNSLSQAVQVRSGTVSSGLAETPPASRTPPLPYFLTEDGSPGGGLPAEDEGLFPAQPVSPDTEKAISTLLAAAPKVKPAMPAASLLPEELSAPSGGEDYALSLIVSDRIAAKDWAAAADQLRKYLSLNRGPKASARARYYLGEALAFMGSGRDAFFEFLSAQELYPSETRPWIEYVLSTLRGSSSSQG